MRERDRHNQSPVGAKVSLVTNFRQSKTVLYF